MDRQDVRTATIQGLRQLADYLEERPIVPLPYLGFLNAFGEAEDLSAIARAMGGFEKRHDGVYLSFDKTFGPVGFSVNFGSEQVCERVVVGTEEVPEKVIPAHTEEIVEWKCPEVLLTHEML